MGNITNAERERRAAEKAQDDDTEELVDALTASIDTPTFDEMGDALLRELWRRIKDPVAVKDLPGAQLMRLSQEYLKLKTNKPREEERQQFDIAALVENANVPLERKLELLRSEHQRGIDLAASVRAAMARLEAA